MDPTVIPDYLICVDLEANCVRKDDGVLEPQEITEWPAIVIDVAKAKIVGEFHTYVKPEVHRVTPFCMELTGVKQQDVENGLYLDDAMQKFARFLQQYSILSFNKKWHMDTFAFVTDGTWDFDVCLKREFNRRNCALPWFFTSYFDIRKTTYEMTGKNVRNFRQTRTVWSVKHQGRLHSGLDDTKTIAQIVIAMLKKGWTPLINNSLSNQIETNQFYNKAVTKTLFYQ